MLAERLTKRYGPATVVDDLSFTVRPGVVTGFLGPNGAGKSTTMRMMLGLTRPDGGTATVGGRAYRDLTYPLRHVGALLETSAPHRGMTAVGHLSWLARSNRVPRRRVDEVLDAVGLTEAARKRVGTFSLGMGQRLGLAAALLGDPRSWCSTSRSTGSTPRASGGCANCCAPGQPRAAPSSSPAI
ncbi:ABC transporter ATP-binding protein [Streptomyces erythrogriseus]